MAYRSHVRRVGHQPRTLYLEGDKLMSTNAAQITATQSCVKNAHVYDGDATNPGRCYTCERGKQKYEVGSLTYIPEDQLKDLEAKYKHRDFVEDHTIRTESGISLKPWDEYWFRQRPVLHAIELLADMFSMSAPDDQGRNRFKVNPLMTLKRARWFLDNAIMQEERK